jgi:C1A family cysteine protease
MGNYFTAPQDEPIRYGWAPDKYDVRDTRLYFTNHQSDDNVDLRSKCPDVYDQGNLGSCTAQAICFAYEFNQMKQNEPDPFIPSRLFLYYNERKMEDTTTTDSGAQIRDGMHCISKGVCKESDWPYLIPNFAVKPPYSLYQKALHHRSIKYQRLDQQEHQIKVALTNGYPVVFGIRVYESFESIDVYKTGIVPYPKKGEDNLGGHAIALVGYDDDKKHFIFRNSWGASWGDKGYGYIPYKYVLDENLASDFWIIEHVKDDDEDSDEKTPEKKKREK